MIRTKSLLHFSDDRIGIFFPRIVRSDDGVISKFIGHAAHERALLSVPVSSAPESDKQFARLELTQGFQDIKKRVIGMRVIDKNLKLPFRGNHFEASRNL